MTYVELITSPGVIALFVEFIVVPVGLVGVMKAVAAVIRRGEK
jgi:hypothetical protein